MVGHGRAGERERQQDTAGWERERQSNRDKQEREEMRDDRPYRHDQSMQSLRDAREREVSLSHTLTICLSLSLSHFVTSLSPFRMKSLSHSLSHSRLSHPPSSTESLFPSCLSPFLGVSLFFSVSPVFLSLSHTLALARSLLRSSLSLSLSLSLSRYSTPLSLSLSLSPVYPSLLLISASIPPLHSLSTPPRGTD